MKIKYFFAFLLLISFAACTSAAKDKSRNTISPGDPEFDPDPDKEELKLSDLSEQEILEQAQTSYEKQLYSVSRENWTTLRDTYPGSSYATLAELKIADCYFFAEDYAAAIPAYEEFLKLHPAHEAIAYVIFQIGNAYKQQYTGTAHDQGPLYTALKYYKRVIASYPNSEFVEASAEAIKECNTNLAAHEAIVAKFYEKQKKPEASKERLTYIAQEYSQTTPGTWAKARLRGENIEIKKEEEKKTTIETPKQIENPQAATVEENIEPQVIAKKSNSKNIENKKSAKINFQPTAINCEESDNSTIATFYFKEGISARKSTEGNSSNSFIIANKNLENNFSDKYFSQLSKEQFTQDLNCAKNNFQFSAEKLSDPKNSKMEFIKYKFETGNKETSFFTLDRPNRFVAIIFH